MNIIDKMIKYQADMKVHKEIDEFLSENPWIG